MGGGSPRCRACSCGLQGRVGPASFVGGRMWPRGCRLRLGSSFEPCRSTVRGSPRAPVRPGYRCVRASRRRPRSAPGARATTGVLTVRGTAGAIGVCARGEVCLPRRADASDVGDGASVVGERLGLRKRLPVGWGPMRPHSARPCLSRGRRRASSGSLRDARHFIAIFADQSHAEARGWSRSGGPLGVKVHRGFTWRCGRG